MRFARRFNAIGGSELGFPTQPALLAVLGSTPLAGRLKHSRECLCCCRATILAAKIKPLKIDLFTVVGRQKSNDFAPKALQRLTKPAQHPIYPLWPGAYAMVRTGVFR